MSELTITHSGNSVLANSAGSSISTGRRKIIRVTPTLDNTGAYADGDVLFQMTEIPNAVKEDGGTSKILGAYVIDKDQDTFGVDLMFFEKNTTELGSLNTTANINDDNFIANGFCGILRMVNTVAKSGDIDGLFVYKCMSISDSSESVEPILLQANSGSTSAYVSGVINTGTPTFASADKIQLVIHIEY